ncbi:hypothetical protein PFISCL1PPCAC_22996 [Pristionchus fissidentatus]|uniref:Globin domain-containing protein n=1 Tax=Pristionchus fissidentatus TaxID=1538716 RepID=A0AAV5WI01_9BILA|nr:hypothetical protein PFISCL1PPCAC_22996 [Pristionchus fissidentatus]
MGNDSSKGGCPATARHSDLAAKRYKIDGGRPRRKAHSTSCSPPRIKRGSDDRYSVEPSSPDENSSSTRSTEEEQIVVPRAEIAFPSRGSEFDSQKHFMARRDRLLIVKSWRKTQKTGAEHVGSKIFLRVLTTQPDIKAIFGLEKIPQGRLKYDPRFRQHALVYTKTFDYVVKNLEFPDKLEHHFDLLGRRHVQYQGRGFTPSFWETFAECMTQTAAEWDQHRHRPTTSAWRSLVSTIIMFMRRGFDDEIGRKKSTSIIRTGALPPSRKSSAYSQPCPVQHQTYTAQQAQELYHAYAYDDQRRHSVCPMDAQRRSKSQTPY